MVKKTTNVSKKSIQKKDVVNSKKAKSMNINVEKQDKVKLTKSKKSKVNFINNLKNIYENSLNKFFVIALIIFSISLVFNVINFYNTGSLVHKGIDLSGGTSIVFSTNTDPILIENNLKENFGHEFIIRNIKRSDSIILEVSTTNSDEIETLIDYLKEQSFLIGEDISIETTASKLGDNFFKQILISLLIAFIFMAITVMIYFKEFIPSIGITYSALADISITVLVLNLFKVPLTSAGIAALLMLIGYSVDTNILLTSRVLKSPSKDFFNDIYNAMKTGFLMSITTLCVVLVGYFVSNSVVLEQIMLVLLIGLIIDLINTWFVNTSILRNYLKKNKRI